MRRRGRGCGNSLELLLDTICNMFGGILFLAMLVTLLLQSSETLDRLSGQDQYQRAEVLRQTLAQLTVDRDRLRESMERIRQQIESLITPELVENYRILRSAQVMRADLERQRKELADSVEQLRREIEVRTREQKRRERQEKELREEVRVAEESLVRYREQRTTSLRLPRMRSSGTSGYVGIVLRFGKAYFWHDPAALHRDELRLNERDFVVVENRGSRGLVTIPDPLRGLDPTDPDELRQFTTTLRSFPRSRWRVAFLVHDDSFETFQKLKSIAVNEGFEYQIAFDDGNIVDRGGSTVVVQ
ncbi:MAG: hypothetical protein Q4C47_05840 [Planctomycetia bacterium]|nr:hypothetical protein [Planctomycetia bacterium]